MTNKLDKASTTSICGFDADTINVRGKDLVNDLVGKLSFTEYWLLQALGKNPSNAQITIVDAVLVTIMEHGLVPSVISSRLTLHGAPESIQGAVAAGILGVGDRYAGTASECGKLFNRVAEASNPESEALNIVKEYRSSKKPLPGFGHPIHKGTDPRVNKLIEICESCETDGKYLKAMHLLEKTLSDELGKEIVTNVSAAIGAVLAEASIPNEMMRGVVITARCAGIIGHLLEENSNPIANDLWEGAQKAVDYKKD